VNIQADRASAGLVSARSQILVHDIISEAIDEWGKSKANFTMFII
jgi:hypothetical protein